MTLGQHIQELRKAAGLSQEALGEKLGVTRQAVSKWESDVTIPEVDTLVAMSRLFGVTVGHLLQVEQPADQPDSELTDRELRAIEAIVARYVEEMEARRPRPEPAPKAKGFPWSRLVAIALCIAVGAFWISYWTSDMNSTINRLQKELYEINNNVTREINGITNQVTQILEAQADLTLDCGADISQIDLRGGAVTLEVWATPKTWQEGMEVTFTVQHGEELLTAQGAEQEGHRFTARMLIPLVDGEVMVDAGFTVDGVTQTQRIWMANGLRTSTWPSVETPGTYHVLYSGQRPKDNKLFMDADDVYVDVYCFDQKQFYDVRVYGGQPPVVESVEVGLFRNQQLVTWLTTTGLTKTGMVPEKGNYMATFSLKEDLTLELAEGDRLALMALVTDSYGRRKMQECDTPLVYQNKELEWEALPVDQETWQDPAYWGM